ncbi:MAG: HAD-IIIC family phosphatase [Acidiferrobacterales bacterium]
MKPGRNVHRFPADTMNVPFADPKARILLYPDGDVERRVIFTWLDFVSYRAAGARERGAATASAKKMKCVVWDLDNTLWKGILLEDGIDGVQLNPQSVALIAELDRRGIVQSVASKNEHEHAWQLIKRLGLQDFFLYPEINWGPKSDSIRSIAKELNIHLDTVAFIDDSPFERAEVSRALPMVRTYGPEEITTLLQRSEFDVRISAESSSRRLSYKAEAERKDVKTRYGDNYEQFLRDCMMEVTVFVPTAPAERERCLELVQRSNQLNLTTRRYSDSEFHALLSDSSVLCLATRCRDRFGDYGTIGFASVRLDGTEPLLMDFVMSCRVAMKKVENAWFHQLRHELCMRGAQVLCANFSQTERNGVLLNVLKEVGFKAEAADGVMHELRLDCGHEVPQADVVTLRFAGVSEVLDSRFGVDGSVVQQQHVEG